VQPDQECRAEVQSPCRCSRSSCVRGRDIHVHQAAAVGVEDIDAAVALICDPEVARAVEGEPRGWMKALGAGGDSMVSPTMKALFDAVAVAGTASTAWVGEMTLTMVSPSGMFGP